jgi:hypothetical protein
MRFYDAVYNVPNRPVLFHNPFKKILSLSYFAIAESPILVYNMPGEVV